MVFDCLRSCLVCGLLNCLFVDLGLVNVFD